MLFDVGKTAYTLLISVNPLIRLLTKSLIRCVGGQTVVI